jgi:DNA mismatch repair protein MutL
MPIHVLSPELASQIAAGEVVERPASVVKELMENALDAGATQVRIEIAGGGRELIRVSDDGAGIPSAEAQLAFERHATSKITSADDLMRVSTLGFRGEALASIASVSQVTCITRARDEEVGTRLRLEGAQVIEYKGIGTPAGTIITVEHLFYNVPARLKFLKAVTTERRHIDALVTRYAIAYPGVRFHLAHDGRVTFQTNGSGSLLDALIAVYGLETAQQMMEISNLKSQISDFGGTSSQQDSNLKSEILDVKCSGYVSDPSLTRANRNELTFFVNGRWVQDRSLAFAVVQAYHTMLQVNRYPLCFLRIELPPEEVDVNVHPAKSEVRFRDSDAVFRTVQKTVRQTLVQRSALSVQHSESREWETGDTETGRQGDQEITRPGDQAQETDRWTPTLRTALSNLQSPTRNTQPPAFSPQPSALSLPPLRVLGQVGTTYIVAEGPEGMYLIDQHAAHERVLYERFMAGLAGATLPVQNLLDPVTVELTPDAVVIVEEHLDLLQRLGFDLEAFGGSTFLMRSVPAVLAQTDLREALNDALAELDAGEMPLQSNEEARLVRRVCKRAAIKAGQVLSQQEMYELIRQLEQCASPRTCPHGRPTMIHLSSDQLAREFGRQ